MRVVFDGVTQSPRMEVCQLVDERGRQNGNNEMRLFQMPGCSCYDSSGHHSSGDDPFAVDHPEWVAFPLHMGGRVAAFLARHLPVSQFQARAAVKVRLNAIVSSPSCSGRRSIGWAGRS